MNDDDEFLPYEEESEEEVQDQATNVEPDATDYEDDEAFLRGQADLESDSGWETGGDNDAAYSDTDAGFTSGADTDAEGEGEEELFPAGTDPMALLDNMEHNRNTNEEGQLQPYELLARQRRLNRARDPTATAGPQAGSSDVFGAGADEIWNEDVAEHLGLSSGRGRKRKSKNKHRPSKGKGSRTKPIPEEISRKLGEANLHYANSRHQEAIALLKAVIKEAPNLPAAWHTMGWVHEARGNMQKALDFFMVSAHLSKDSQEWKRIAKLSTEQGHLRQAIYCYKNAINHDKSDLDAKWDKAVLHDTIGEPRKALKAVNQIALVRPGDVEIAKQQARLHHRLGNAAEAKDILQTHLHSHPTAVDLELINILAELYMNAEEWRLAVDNIQYANTQLCGPTGLPIDLQVKAGICCAHLEADPDSQHGMHEAQCYFDQLLELPLADNADLWLTVADELLQLQHAEEALQFYKRVQELPEYNDKELWSKIAECHEALGSEEEMVAMYEAIMQGSTFPAALQHDAAVALTHLHLDAGDTLAAEQVMSLVNQLGGAEDPDVFHDVDSQDGQALFHRAGLMLRLGKQDSFLELMLPVIADSIRQAEQHGEGHADPAGPLDPSIAKALRRRQRGISSKKDLEEAGTVFKGYTTRDRRRAHVKEADEAAEAVLAAGGGTPRGSEVVTASADGTLVTGLAAAGAGLFKQDTEFSMLVQAGRMLLQLGRLAEAKTLIQSSIRLFAKRWMDKSRRDVLQMVLAEIHIAGQEFGAAYEALKPVCYRWPSSVRVWNTYCRVLGGMGGTKHSAKFLLPMRAKHPSSLPLMLLAAHSLSQTSHTQALGEFFHAYRLNPREPLTLLCIALAYIQQAMTRKVDDRNRTILQAFAFLQEYAQYREDALESNYNVGRAAHHLGLVHIAAQYYQKCLNSTSSLPSSPANEDGQGLSLHAATLMREAAFNLSLIYRGAGADDLARQVLRQHVTI
ncbi:hypothetical protein ABBQ32_000232 [Trebouxia sp. C0010 RCD-2024]